LGIALDQGPKIIISKARQEGMNRAQLIKLIKTTSQETLKEFDLERMVVEKLEDIDWQQKAKETVKLTILKLRGKVV